MVIPGASSDTRTMPDTSPPTRDWQLATVAAFRDETPSVKTIAFALPRWPGHLAGQHVDIRLTADDGYQAERSYSIASPPEDAGIAITVKRIDDGEVSPYLTDELRGGDPLELRGPIGGYFTWHVDEGGPLLLVGGGSGLVPLMAIGLIIAFAARPPDVLVSDDSKLIALRSGAEIFLVRAPKANNFTLEQWQNVWGATPLTPAACSAESCLVGSAWYTTVASCAPAQLIVAPIEMPSCPAPVIDRFATYRQGAIAAWITPHGVLLRTDRQVQGTRPWVLPYPQL